MVLFSVAKTPASFARCLILTIFAVDLICQSVSQAGPPPGWMPPSPEVLFDFAHFWLDPGNQEAELILLLEGTYPTPTPSSTSTTLATPTQAPSDTTTPTGTTVPPPSPGFVNFENAPIHPVDLSPNGQTLCVANLPDYRLMVFDVTSGIPVETGSVPVGVDPVSARFRSDTEVWVVNRVSDSISIVDVSTLRVVATLETHDEPCDVVFAGTPQRAFVSCSQANEVQVFDPTNLAAPPVVIPIDAGDPRALAVSTDGSRVYAAIFDSGNGSTVLGGGARDFDIIDFPPNIVSDPIGPYGGVNPPPNDETGFNPPQKPGNPPPPRVGLIVKKDRQGKWRDDNQTDWTEFVSGSKATLSGRVPGWDLPDRDVAFIDVASQAVIGYATGLMNICMSVEVNPGNGRVTVIGTDGTNEIRFEPVVGGRFLRDELALADPAVSATSSIKDLNPHLAPYSSTIVAPAKRMKSIGDPRSMVWNSAGTKGYVGGMGSNNLVVVDSNGDRAALAPTIEVGEGPAGMAIDESRNRLYVLNRFGASISVVSTVTETEVARIPFFDPTPNAIKAGRRHFYNTHENSGLGHLACASCHIDGRMDRLAWDLGNPAGDMKSVNPTDHNLGANFFLLSGGFQDFHPMKGPMTTQTLQDIIGHEPLHWRGDRNGLEEFNGAFVSLQGNDHMLSPTEMQEFEDFLDSISFPPNPNRNFDNSLPAVLPLPGHFTTGRFGPAGQPLPHGNPLNGLDIYTDTGRRIDRGAFACVTCHTLPTGMGTDMTLPTSLPPFVERMLGPNGERHHALVSVDGSTNITMKVPHLRNQMEKAGCNFTQTSNRAGFGYQHDGTIDSLERFVSEGAFNVASDQEVADLVAFVFCIPGSELPEGSVDNLLNPPGPPSQDSHAAVGKQVTVSATAEVPIVTQMIMLAAVGKVDLVVKAHLAGVQRGAFYDSVTGLFLTDVDGETISPADLRNLAAVGSEITYTIVPRGTGHRVGIDRDGDGFGDRTEILAGSNPDDPLDTP
jgi:YVTN family beta-propeller protein